MEQLLEEVKNDTPMIGTFSSQFFQPERVQLSSDSDASIRISQDPNSECFFNEFTVRLPRPALNVKSVQLVRASVPNPTTNIPDNECVFWYYRIPKAAVFPLTPSEIFTPQNLHMVRLLPSWYKKELNQMSGSYGFNQTFPDYQSLSTELIKSCADDPLNGFNDLFIPNDISLVYDISCNKVKMYGNNVYVDDVYSFNYAPAGYLDRNVLAAQQTLSTLSEEYDSFGPYPPQPYLPYKTLNLRLGFTWDGANLNLIGIGNSQNTTAVNNVLAYRFRPPISFQLSRAISEIPSDYIYTAESYINLVYTTTVSLYSSFIAGATTDSQRNNNLIAAVPMNCSNLGITFYNPVIPNPLTKIVDQIYEITVQIFTDTGSPYYLPNSAIVSIELAFTY